MPLFPPPTILLIGINGIGPFKSTYKANFKILRHFLQEYLIVTKIHYILHAFLRDCTFLSQILHIEYNDYHYQLAIKLTYFSATLTSDLLCKKAPERMSFSHGNNM